MLGFIVGTLCLIALVKVVRRHHHWHHAHAYGWGGGCGQAGYHPRWHGGWHGRGGWGGWHEHPWRSGPWREDERGESRDERPRGFDRRSLYPILRKLDLTPAQEKVVFAAADELRGKLAALRDAWLEKRKDLADAVRGPILTDEQAQLLVGTFDPQLDALRASAAESLRKLHEALDDGQRRHLAELLEAIGPGAFRF